MTSQPRAAVPPNNFATPSTDRAWFDTNPWALVQQPTSFWMLWHCLKYITLFNRPINYWMNYDDTSRWSFFPQLFNLTFLLFNPRWKLQWNTSFYFGTFLEDVKKGAMKSWARCIAACLLLYWGQSALGWKLNEIIIWQAEKSCINY